VLETTEHTTRYREDLLRLHRDGITSFRAAFHGTGSNGCEGSTTGAGSTVIWPSPIRSGLSPSLIPSTIPAFRMAGRRVRRPGLRLELSSFRPGLCAPISLGDGLHGVQRTLRHCVVLRTMRDMAPEAGRPGVLCPNAARRGAHDLRVHGGNCPSGPRRKVLACGKL
jgi:hypothetical protein